jgi:hypothetical protein
MLVAPAGHLHLPPSSVSDRREAGHEQRERSDTLLIKRFFQLARFVAGHGTLP